jgi:ATP-dependent DNA ligase
MGLDGIISKRADSRYKSGRCLSWVKAKKVAEGLELLNQLVGKCE